MGWFDDPKLSFTDLDFKCLDFTPERQICGSKTFSGNNPRML